MVNSYLQNIISITKDDTHKIINIFGIKFKFKSQKQILRQSCKNLEVKNDIIIQNCKKILEDNKTLRKTAAEIKNQTTKTECFIQNIKQLNNEKVILPNDYYPYFDNNDIKEDYLNLIKGLDETSTLNVQKALSRIQQVKETGSELHYLNNKEMEDFRNYTSNFIKAVVQLNENTWAYKDYLLPVSFFDASVFYFKHNLCDYNKIDYNKCVIDAGASVGDSAVLFSRLFKNVYSFEPTAKLFQILNKTVELNKLKNVYPQQMGLLDEICDKNIYFAGRCGQSTSINEYRDDGKNGEKVSFTTIDEFVKDNNIEVGLIKADVEGAERLLLKGALETIKTQKPALNISIYHSAQDFFKIKPMIEELNLGYKFKITRPAITNIVVETCLLAEVE